MKNAAWLAEPAHDLIREAFQAGQVTAEHVTAIRAVATASKARRATFLAMQTHLVAMASNCDPARTATNLKLWADAVDAADGDDDADKSWNKRGFHLSPVGDGWDIRGYLPAAEGAELAGILNAYLEQNHRTSHNSNHSGEAGAPDGDGDSAHDGHGHGAGGRDGDGGGGWGAEPVDDRSPSQKRADALMDLARAAATGVTTGARDRAKATILLPATRLHPHTNTNAAEGDAEAAGDGAGAGAGVAGAAGVVEVAGIRVPVGLLAQGRPAHHAASWAVGNGPGEGFLAWTDALRLTCDAEITRLILGPQSQPLDIGRTTRVVPAHIRRALDIRDGGCIICPPGERPPGWCEAHHLHHWSQGGETSVSNLVLLCSRHHHDLHRGHWTITMTPHGTPTIRPGPTHPRPG